MIEIRNERPEDAEAIRALTHAAFRDMPFSNQTEPAIIDGLRLAGALALSLVADDDAVVGHIAFSPVTIGGREEGWYGLGPVSVAPERQGRGIGSRLINDGLDRLRAWDAKGVVLVGDPAYYGRFGFFADSALSYSEAPAEYVQRLLLNGDAPKGAIVFHPAFDTA